MLSWFVRSAGLPVKVLAFRTASQYIDDMTTRDQRYNASPKGKRRQARYEQTEKGKARQRRYQEKKRRARKAA